MRVQLPSGLVVDVRAEAAQAVGDLAAFCRGRDEHVAKLGRGTSRRSIDVRPAGRLRAPRLPMTALELVIAA